LPLRTSPGGSQWRGAHPPGPAPGRTPAPGAATPRLMRGWGGRSDMPVEPGVPPGRRPRRPVHHNAAARHPVAAVRGLGTNAATSMVKWWTCAALASCTPHSLHCRCMPLPLCQRELAGQFCSIESSQRGSLVMHAVITLSSRHKPRTRNQV